MVLLIGTNPRWESPVFNARLRKVTLDGTAIGLVGEPVDLTYKYEHVGSDPAALAALAGGQHPWLERLKKAARPAVVVGPGVLRRADREAVMRAVHDLCAKAGGLQVKICISTPWALCVEMLLRESGCTTRTQTRSAVAEQAGSAWALCAMWLDLVFGWAKEAGVRLHSTHQELQVNQQRYLPWSLGLPLPLASPTSNP